MSLYAGVAPGETLKEELEDSTPRLAKVRGETPGWDGRTPGMDVNSKN